MKTDRARATLHVLIVAVVYLAAIGIVLLAARWNLLAWSDVREISDALSAVSNLAVGVLVGFQIGGSQ